MIEIGDYKFSIDGYFKQNLDIILNEAIPNDWDALFIISGKEGSGKSTISTQMALYLDHDFNIENVAWLPDQFEKAVENAKPGSTILWDEAITGANAAAWGSKVSQSVISKLTQIRKKNLKIIICFPYLHMLNKYFVSRCISSIYVYAKSFTDRGHAFFYTQDQTEDLYSFMKEKYRLTPRKAFNRCTKSFFFRFSKQFCLPKEEYENRKDAAARSGASIEENHWKTKFIKAIKFAKQKRLMTEFSQFMGVTTQRLYDVQKARKRNIID